LIDGAPWAKDGKGEIARLNLNGKIIDTTWVTGLNAPKGMGIHANKLYVADLNEVVVIDIASGKIENRIAIEGAENLNDITINNKGTVYVSDSKGAKVYELKNGKAATYLTDLPGINGLKAVNDDLYILTRKDVYRAGADKNTVKISELERGGDGIEPVGNGDFITSTWAGYINYIHKDGKTDLLLDTHEQKKNTADIGYDPVKRIVYVPTFFGKSVVAYQLQ
jgi:hypothetical protein